MNKNILQDKIKEIEVKLMSRNKENWGFPVGAVIFTETGKRKAIAVNAKGSGEDTNPSKHAEAIMLEKFDESIKDLYLLITLPPCETCLKKIVEKGMFKKIYVMFDPRNKKEQDQYNDVKDRIIYLDKFKTEPS